MTDTPAPDQHAVHRFDQRIEELLERLTLEERIALLHQCTPAVERLGLADFRTGQEALHGVAWMGPATVFPQAVGLGATWNDELVRRVGDAVSAEVRAMRARDDQIGFNVWAPTVNLLRHPWWGRNEEGYAEDPHLTAAMATAFTRGLRGDHPTFWRTAPVLKHWLAHNNETHRDTTSSSVRPRVLHEYDLRAFRAPVQAGAVAGVMPAYNLVNGRPNHLSPHLRRQLRTWTDAELLICSDAGAPSNLADSQAYYDTHEEATAAALIAGVDSFTDHGSDSSIMTGRVRRALDQGLVSRAEIDAAVRRQLSVRARLGEFEECDPFADVRDFDTEEHRSLAREAAEQAVVLLKNDGLLPLAADTRIAVVGLLADECKTDWYSGTLLRRSTPLVGLRERFGAQHVTFTEGVDRVRIRCADGWLQVPVDDAEERRVGGADGDRELAPLADRPDAPPLTCGTEPAELALIDWGGGVLTLRAPDGRYLSVADDGFLRASAAQPGGWIVRETFTAEAHGDGHLIRHTASDGYLLAGADGVRVEETGTVFTLDIVERGAEAVARAAAGADVVIVVAGNDPHINGRETEDRTTLDLPAQQSGLWRAARAVNPRTALVLVSSYPYAVPDADAELPALLWSAHGGQAAGCALARVLAGDVSPAGRLPQTWYASDADLPDLLDYDIIGSRQTYLYSGATPLYPFGHGLGYSSFAYQDLTAARAEDTVRVALTVRNTGTRDADEAAQVYVHPPRTSVPRPVRQLVAHRRVALASGSAVRLEFEVPLADLGYWDVAHGRWTVGPGTYEIQTGASSADIRLVTRLTIEGEAPAPRPAAAQGLQAADYDEQRGTVLVDRTRTDGDSVTPAGQDGGELLFTNCDFGAEGVCGVVVEAAGAGVIEVGDSTLRIEDIGGPYQYARHSADFTAAGVRDLRVRLSGPVRLAVITFVSRAGV